jgi:hypothetical protein
MPAYTPSRSPITLSPICRTRSVATLNVRVPVV